MTTGLTFEQHEHLGGNVIMSGGRTLHAYLTEAKYESLRMLRSPSFGAIFLSLPVLIYLLFAVVIFGHALRSDAVATVAVFTGFSVFGVMGPAMFGFGVTIAMEREQGLLRFKHALPAPAGAYVVAKMLMAMLFAAIIMVTMCAAAVLLAHVPLPFPRLIAIAIVNVMGVLPFCAIGLFIGAIVKGAAAPGFTNLVYLPMMYLSGLFFPLPKGLAAVAPMWPAYHLNQLSLTAAGAPLAGTAIHLTVLLGVTALFSWLALSRLRRAN
jgi:ABC-2 type transport system permease protein